MFQHFRTIIRLLFALVCCPLPALAADPLKGESTLQIAAILHDPAAFAGAHDIEIHSGLAYLAGKRGSLAIVDIREPAAPKLLWHVLDSERYPDAETVLPLGPGRLLVGTRDLHLFDVALPTQPKLLTTISQHPQVDTINGFARLGDATFAANKFGHIFAIDVAAPNQLRLLGSRETRASGELTSPHDLAFCGDLLVVVSPEGFGRVSKFGRLAIYRVADPQTNGPLPVDQWTLLGQLEHQRLAGANRVRIRGSIAIVASSLTQNLARTDDLRANVALLDLGNPASPTLLGSIEFPDNRGPNGLEIADRIAFAAGGQTVQAIDITQPTAPREIARLTSPESFPGAADDAHDLVYSNNHLFITAQSSHSLVILRVSPTIFPK